MQKIGFWSDIRTTKNGVDYIKFSHTRLLTTLAMPFCLMMSWGVIERTLDLLISNFNWEMLTYSLVQTVVINLIWIAPTHLTKLVSEKGIINKFFDLEPVRESK